MVSAQGTYHDLIKPFFPISLPCLTKANPPQISFQNPRIKLDPFIIASIPALPQHYFYAY